MHEERRQFAEGLWRSLSRKAKENQLITMSAEPAVRQLTPVSASATGGGEPTVDDEAIARLLQQEFDDEARLEAIAAAQAATSASAQQDGASAAAAGDESGSMGERRGSQAFALPDMRAKLTDLISFIKTEASKAAEASPLSAIATTPGGAAAAVDRSGISPTSPTVAPAMPQNFDFTRFLDQMRDRRALPLTKYFRSFLREFTKRKWTVNEQIKIVRDFLDFMAVQLEKNELYAGANEDELENAREGMEKLLMNKLHQYTFSPSTADDGAKDEVLYKKIQILQWIELKHLDIHLESEVSGPFLRVAQKELLKMNEYKAPRDKLICILNACKLIFGLLKTSGNSETADSFLPLLIFTVLQANPPHLVSNIQYISRFRHPAKLQSEAGYYLTNLMGAVAFIESIDAAALSIDKAEFDQRIEARMRELEDLEADRRAQRALAALDQQQQQQGGASPVAASSVGPAATSDPLVSQQQLEQLAANVKKPIELVTRWFAQAAASLASPDSPSPSPSSPSSAAAGYPGHAGSAAAAAGAGAGVATELVPVDLSHLSAEERLLMSDYEMQLAMAMSMSLEEERIEWERVPDDLLSAPAVAAVGSGAGASESPKSATAELDEGIKGFSLEESASGAAKDGEPVPAPANLVI
ncbi:hypothetical protein BC828DRAFT_354604 [Blastocladiella britannica]|nr:hypothetical protein BC828DRAFT_354604 [Blastocladiella britannica]